MILYDGVDYVAVHWMMSRSNEEGCRKSVGYQHVGAIRRPFHHIVHLHTVLGQKRTVKDSWFLSKSDNHPMVIYS